MKLFDVYPRFNVTPVSANGVYVTDDSGQKYLDLYGGHGVISIGHTHPHYVNRIENQLEQIAFYSNSIQMPIQEELADKLGQICDYPNYELFLCNSGAEANENTIKLASFHTGKKKMIAFKNSFHGRTAAALNVTDNPHLQAAINQTNFEVEFLPLNQIDLVKKALEKEDVAAVIIEGIQGVGGLDEPTSDFLEALQTECHAHGALLILDEIQSGYGRSGHFFAHQNSSVKADIISMAKGMGNGFPIAGVLIHPKIEAKAGLLGTTFGGNHLACAAGLAVLEVVSSENLMENVKEMNAFLMDELSKINGIKKIKGRGLMLGVELDKPVKTLRSDLLFNHHIFTGASANPNLIRILPPLTITKTDLVPFIEALNKLL